MRTLAWRQDALHFATSTYTTGRAAQGEWRRTRQERRLEQISGGETSGVSWNGREGERALLGGGGEGVAGGATCLSQLHGVDAH